MKRSSAAHLNCSVARSLEVLGEWWTLLILRDAFFGVRRFEGFVADLGISRAVLTDRLGTLVEHGILERRRYQERPDRYEYRLTDKGRDLLPVVVALMHWGDKWLSTPEVGGPPLTVTHVVCGHDVAGPLLCAHCHEAVGTREIALAAGPGARPQELRSRAPESQRVGGREAPEVELGPSRRAPEQAGSARVQHISESEPLGVSRPSRRANRRRRSEDE